MLSKPDAHATAVRLLRKTAFPKSSVCELPNESHTEAQVEHSNGFLSSRYIASLWHDLSLRDLCFFDKILVVLLMLQFNEETTMTNNRIVIFKTNSGESWGQHNKDNIAHGKFQKRNKEHFTGLTARFGISRLKPLVLIWFWWSGLSRGGLEVFDGSFKNGIVEK